MHVRNNNNRQVLGIPTEKAQAVHSRSAITDSGPNLGCTYGMVQMDCKTRKRAFDSVFLPSFVYYPCFPCCTRRVTIRGVRPSREERQFDCCSAARLFGNNCCCSLAFPPTGTAQPRTRHEALVASVAQSNGPPSHLRPPPILLNARAWLATPPCRRACSGSWQWQAQSPPA